MPYEQLQAKQQIEIITLLKINVVPYKNTTYWYYWNKIFRSKRWAKIVISFSQSDIHMNTPEPIEFKLIAGDNKEIK